jgi:hypothetical protein
MMYLNPTYWPQLEANAAQVLPSLLKGGFTGDSLFHDAAFSAAQEKRAEVETSHM